MNQPRHLAGTYVFGGSAAEIARLQQLGELLQPSTRRALLEAGIAKGMRVLDVAAALDR